MTEAEWLTATDATPMLYSLHDVSERKLRLMACGCCRLIPGYMESDSDRNGLELTELDVDGLAPDNAFDGIDEVWDVRWYRRDGWNALDRAIESYWSEMWGVERLHEISESEKAQVTARWGMKLTSVIREIFGNPFRAVAADPAWLSSTAVALAQGIYDDRAFDRLPILADALQDAGCENADILTHCRGDGPHVRGCWVIDLVLGKQ